MIKKYINIDFETSPDVSKEQERIIKNSFLHAVKVLEKEWNIKESMKVGVSILSDSKFHDGAVSGPQSWKYCFLLRDHSENKLDYKNNRVYCDAEIFKVLPKDADKMIKHEIAHIVVYQLIKDFNTYRKSYLLEEGTAGLDDATNLLINKLRRERINKIPNPLLIKTINDEKAIGGNTNIEPFTQQLGCLIVLSFIDFLRERIGEQKIIEIYNNLNDKIGLEESYKQICEENLIDVMNKWRKSIKNKIA